MGGNPYYVFIFFNAIFSRCFHQKCSFGTYRCLGIGKLDSIRRLQGEKCMSLAVYLGSNYSSHKRDLCVSPCMV